MRVFVLALAALPLLGGCSGQGNAPSTAHIQPGYWEQRVEIVEPKEGRGGQTVLGRCISSEQATRPVSLFEATARESHCELTGFTMADGRMHGTLTCRFAGGGVSVDSTRTIEGTYSETRFDMTVRGEAVFDNGEHHPMESRSTSRRLRDCRPGDPAHPG